MNVSDALLLPSFEGATVIAGRAGLDREVSTAMIVEAPDIESWGKSDQMLITSFYAFENLSADGLTFFFDKADELGIGAIVFKPERLLAEATGSDRQALRQARSSAHSDSRRHQV